MTRVSTSGNFGVMTSNLMRAQVLQNVAGEQVSSQKNANDLKGYAKNAEVLTAMKTAQAKVAGFRDQTTLVSNRLDVQDIGGNPGTLLDEPFRGGLGLLTKISWIDGRRMIWMQQAFRSFDPIIGNTEHVFVLRSLVMHAHLLRPQHHQSKFSRRIVHVSHPSFCASMSPREVKGTLIPPPGKAIKTKSPDGPARVPRCCEPQIG